MADPIRLFYSYSRKDAELRQRLQNHLRAYEKDGLLRGWHDAKIPGGDEWKKSIEQHIGQDDIVLLLMTEDYQASEWCMAEYDLAMQRHEDEKGKFKVIPINLRAVEWPQSLKALNGVPPLSDPILNGTEGEIDAKFMLTAGKIAEVARELRSARSGPVLAQPTSLASAVSLPPPESLRIVRPPRPVTRDLALLCNWTDQEDELRAGFDGLPQAKLRTPFLTLVCGHSEDCPEDFISRTRNSPLAERLGVKTVNGPILFDWPHPAALTGVPNDQLFLSRISAALGIASRDESQIARRLPKGLTIIRSTIDSWSDLHTPRVLAYAAFWDSWPPMGPGKALAPFLCIKGTLGNELVDVLRQRVAFANFERLRGAVVGLLPILQSHAERWLALPQIQPLYEKRCTDLIERDVRAIFVDGQARMKQVADGLTGVLLSHSGEHQHAG
jgi:TIR domain